MIESWSDHSSHRGVDGLLFIANHSPQPHCKYSRSFSPALIKISYITFETPHLLVGGAHLDKIIEGTTDQHPSIRLGAAKYLSALLIMGLGKEENEWSKKGGHDGGEKGNPSFSHFFFNQYIRSLFTLDFLALPRCFHIIIDSLLKCLKDKNKSVREAAKEPFHHLWESWPREMERREERMDSEERKRVRALITPSSALHHTRRSACHSSHSSSSALSAASLPASSSSTVSSRVENCKQIEDSENRPPQQSNMVSLSLK